VSGDQLSVNSDQSGGRRLKPWRCRREHVLGMVERVQINGRHVDRLLLYRRAIVEGEGAVEVMAVAQGTVLDVRCSVCGAVRTWVEIGG
jgi:hypothetical protein